MFTVIYLAMFRYLVLFVLSGSGWGVLFLQTLTKGIEEDGKPNLSGYLVIAITALAGTAIFLYKMKDKTDKEFKTALGEHAKELNKLHEKNAEVLTGLINKLNNDQAERAEKHNKFLTENTLEQRNVQEALRSIKTFIELKLAV